jgi:hypothetical protein
MQPQVAEGAADVEEPVSIESDPFVAEAAAEVIHFRHKT